MESGYAAVVAISGVLRDVVNLAVSTFDSLAGVVGEAAGYLAVYGIEVALLVLTIVTAWPLLRGKETPPGTTAPALRTPG